MDLYELIEFAKEYRDLGHAVQEQLDALASDCRGAELNPNAVDAMADLIPSLARIEPDVADELGCLIEEWREAAPEREQAEWEEAIV